VGIGYQRERARLRAGQWHSLVILQQLHIRIFSQTPLQSAWCDRLHKTVLAAHVVWGREDGGVAGQVKAGGPVAEVSGLQAGVERPALYRAF